MYAKFQIPSCHIYDTVPHTFTASRAFEHCIYHFSCSVRAAFYLPCTFNALVFSHLLLSPPGANLLTPLRALYLIGTWCINRVAIFSFQLSKVFSSQKQTISLLRSKNVTVDFSRLNVALCRCSRHGLHRFCLTSRHVNKRNKN